MDILAYEKAICYSGYRQGQSPKTEPPTKEQIAEDLDFISVHSYPLHYGEGVDVAVEMNRKHYEDIKKLFPDKQVLFTEVGWTTKPNSRMKAGEACVENQKRYINELQKWLDRDRIIGFVFEAFDEPWKGSSPEKSECNWGLYYVDRTPKW